ncbi:hypothetical protein KAR91_50965 [Candidatus Pacearchaeota archaeon]|nr:hypothetical protein [Candidatus Pacearchaeota archaeon]
MSMALVLKALKHAPSIFNKGKEIFENVTGQKSKAANEEELTQEIENLPPNLQMEIEVGVLAAKMKMQELDTERFTDMNKGDTAHIKATARPETARRAMAIIEIVPNIFKWLVIATFVQWFVAVLAVFLAKEGQPAIVIPSIFGYFAQLQPVIEPFMALLFGVIWKCTAVILKYMGCRERDKAQEYEMKAGKPLHSAATMEGAADGILGAIKAWRGK